MLNYNESLIDIYSLNPFNGARETISQDDYDYNKKDSQVENNNTVTSQNIINEVIEIVDVEVEEIEQEVQVSNYTLIAKVNPENKGNKIKYNNTSLQTHNITAEENTEIILNSVSSNKYSFVNWTDSNSNIIGTDTRLITTITKDDTITANFSIKQFSVSVVYNNNQGTITGSGIYEYGSNAILTATPLTNYTFDGWKINNTTHTETTIELSNITSDIELTANFTKIN